MVVSIRHPSYTAHSPPVNGLVADFAIFFTIFPPRLAARGSWETNEDLGLTQITVAIGHDFGSTVRFRTTPLHWTVDSDQSSLVGIEWRWSPSILKRDDSTG